VPVVACTIMNREYEDSDSQCYSLSKEMTGNPLLWGIMTIHSI